MNKWERMSLEARSGHRGVLPIRPQSGEGKEATEKIKEGDRRGAGETCMKIEFIKSSL